MRLFKIPTEEFEKHLNIELSKEKVKEILDILKNSNNLRTKEEFEEIKIRLYTSCRKGEIELTKIYLNEKIENEDLTFKIDKSNQTASLFKVNKIFEQLTIPRTVKHESIDYLITSITGTGNNIKTIKFVDNSAMRTIYSDAFSQSKIEEIHFPSSLIELQSGWCFGTDELTKIIISPSNGQLIFQEDKYLLGKTDPNSDEFDNFLYAIRNTKEISIPSNIKIISPFAFYQCYDLTKVEIPTNSNLEIIGSDSFSQTYIEEIYIPPKVLKICEFAFYECQNLKRIEIPQNSNLQTIESNAFRNSTIEEIFLPMSLKVLEEGWCYLTDHLTKITVSLLNDNFMLKDGKCLLGKCDPNNIEFDKLLFASRNIKDVAIPSNIKIISQCAFQWCDNLTKVDIPTDSNLQTIESLAFCSSSIRYIFIPSNVSKICEFAFSYCYYLKNVEIATDSILQTIEPSTFEHSYIDQICIPPNISKICESAFSDCWTLQIIEISEGSKLESIQLSSFSGCKKLIIMIPSLLNNLIP